MYQILIPIASYVYVALSGSTVFIANKLLFNILCKFIAKMSEISAYLHEVIRNKLCYFTMFVYCLYL